MHTYVVSCPVITYAVVNHLLSACTFILTGRKYAPNNVSHLKVLLIGSVPHVTNFVDCISEHWKYTFLSRVCMYTWSNIPVWFYILHQHTCHLTMSATLLCCVYINVYCICLRLLFLNIGQENRLERWNGLWNGLWNFKILKQFPTQKRLLCT